MKKMKKMLYVLLIVVLIMPVITAVSVEAAAKTPAPAYNGKWTYYAIIIRSISSIPRMVRQKR